MELDAGVMVGVFGAIFAVAGALFWGWTQPRLRKQAERPPEPDTKVHEAAAAQARERALGERKAVDGALSGDDPEGDVADLWNARRGGR